MTLERVDRLVDAVRAEIGKVIVGQEEAVELLLTSLLCGGHVLLEGVPGTGKTFLVQAFAAGLDLEFGRIQFTPDMMPGDVLGTNLFNFQTNSFTLTKGPIFTQILLADEINRTPPKTQAALLQAMGERAVTIDRQTHELGWDFMVVATQNPIEQQGTYPLPEAQLDRFLFKIVMGYPERDEEKEIVLRHGASPAMPRPADFGVGAAATRAELAAAREVWRPHSADGPSGGLYCGHCAGHARPSFHRDRSLPPRGHHDGRRRPRARRRMRARLRHSRRCEASDPALAAAPHRHDSGGGYRGTAGR